MRAFDRRAVARAGAALIAVIAFSFASNACTESNNRSELSRFDIRKYEMIGLKAREAAPYTFPLDSITARDTLRVLTRNTGYTYFLHRGTEMGFEYELIRSFADSLGVNLKMVVPPKWDDMIPWLLDGRGDIIAAAMTVTPERAEQVAFSDPYQTVHQVVVTRDDVPVIETAEDLVGKSVHVRVGSSYYRRLVELNEEFGGGIKIVAVPEQYDTEYIFQLLSDRIIDITVADNNIAQLEQGQFSNLRIDARISDDQNIAWAVRPGAGALLNELNAFVASLYTTAGRSATYNILYRRYFIHASRHDTFRSSLRRFRTDGTISQYDPVIRKYADRYGLSFSLIAALEYQESRFDPNATSWVGAVGLMQLMPRTAASLGVQDIFDIEENVEAGVRYLRSLYDRFDDTLHPYDRMAFALASYNAGYDHVRDARTLAEEDGLNPDYWAGNVEWMLLNLSRQEYYQRVPAGYARGHEAVNYVNGIMDRARTYQALLDGRSDPEVQYTLAENTGIDPVLYVRANTD